METESECLLYGEHGCLGGLSELIFFRLSIVNHNSTLYLPLGIYWSISPKKEICCLGGACCSPEDYEIVAKFYDVEFIESDVPVPVPIGGGVVYAGEKFVENYNIVFQDSTFDSWVPIHTTIRPEEKFFVKGMDYNEWIALKDKILETVKDAMLSSLTEVAKERDDVNTLMTAYVFVLEALGVDAKIS
jgi:hypothetical protein